MPDILLDTHAFLWYLLDDSRLSPTARQSIRTCPGNVYLSSISLWEITLKYKHGKLLLPASPERYIPGKRALHGIYSLAFTEEDAANLAALPELHKDPFDRMLICQALHHGLVFITNDRHIQAYPVNTLW